MRCQAGHVCEVKAWQQRRRQQRRSRKCQTRGGTRAPFVCLSRSKPSPPPHAEPQPTHILPSLSMRPLFRIRITISSRALLEGAHTSTCALGPVLRPTRVGGGRSSIPNTSGPVGSLLSSARTSSLPRKGWAGLRV